MGWALGKGPDGGDAWRSRTAVGRSSSMSVPVPCTGWGRISYGKGIISGKPAGQFSRRLLSPKSCPWLLADSGPFGQPRMESFGVRRSIMTPNWKSGTFPRLWRQLTGNRSLALAPRGVRPPGDSVPSNARAPPHASQGRSSHSSRPRRTGGDSRTVHSATRARISRARRTRSSPPPTASPRRRRGRQPG
jgi:hypothetical protein